MNSEPNNDPNERFHESVTTHVYDAVGHLPKTRGEPATAYYDSHGRHVPGPAPVPDTPLTPKQRRLTHTFEFRLTGSETQEQCLPLSPEFPPAEFILATPSVRACVTRIQDPAAASSAIGGVEVQAELRAGAIVCRASLADFSPGDLVVVQVDVTLERKRMPYR
jgi:hypothetical protein